MKKFRLLFLSTIAIVGLLGATQLVAQESTVRKGTIIAITPVEKGKAASFISKRTMRVLGMIAGSQAGGAVGGQAGQAVGMHVGTDAGEAASGAMQASTYDVLVQLSTGDEISIRHKPDDLRTFRAGGKVRIIGTGKDARIFADR